jgi:hypothetical protein
LVRIVADGAPCDETSDSDLIGSSSSASGAADMSVVPIEYVNEFKVFAKRVAEALPDLEAATKRTSRTNAQTQVSELSTQIPVLEVRISLPLELLESGSETSQPHGLRLIASRLLDALCLAAIT